MSWIRDFLSDRTQHVAVNGEPSSEIPGTWCPTRSTTGRSKKTSTIGERLGNGVQHAQMWTYVMDLGGFPHPHSIVIPLSGSYCVHWICYCHFLACCAISTHEPSRQANMSRWSTYIMCRDFSRADSLGSCKRDSTNSQPDRLWSKPVLAPPGTCWHMPRIKTSNLYSDGMPIWSYTPGYRYNHHSFLGSRWSGSISLRKVTRRSAVFRRHYNSDTVENYLKPHPLQRWLVATASSNSLFTAVLKGTSVSFFIKKNRNDWNNLPPESQ